MFVQYGDVFLRVVELTRFDRDAVWTPDRTDLIGVDVILGFLVTLMPGGDPRMDSATVLNPDTVAHLTGSDRTAAALRNNPRGEDPGITAAFFPPVLETELGGRGPVSAGEERSGPETDAEIRLRLWRPRQKLILWAYDRQTGGLIRWVESPRPGFDTDVANGPIPLSLDVVQASGEPNSVVLHFQIQTRMSPCPTGSDRLVLSHRWQMKHGHDENHYLTRTIDGECIFNGAVIRKLGVSPDDIRRQFIHPIPVGMQRASPTVTISSDGLTIKYQVVDTDPTIVFDPAESGCTTIQIAEKVLYQNPTTWNKDNSPGGGIGKPRPG
jgi:hypothetical protein